MKTDWKNKLIIQIQIVIVYILSYNLITKVNSCYISRMAILPNLGHPANELAIYCCDE